MDRQPTRNDFSKWRSVMRLRGHAVELTVEEWIEWWTNTGQYHNRGNYKSNVNMGRIDIEKPWSLGNIKLSTVTEAHSNNKH